MLLNGLLPSEIWKNSKVRSENGMETKKSSLKNELFDYCWPTRTRTLNKTTKMSCVTITPSAKTVNSGAKVMGVE